MVFILFGLWQCGFRLVKRSLEGVKKSSSVRISSENARSLSGAKLMFCSDQKI